METRAARRPWRRALLALALLGAAALAAATEDAFAAARLRMVTTQIEARGVRDPRVLDAMRRVQRHRFVPERLRDQAYEDRPLPIGHDQTISQPYIVALMTELARREAGRPGAGDRHRLRLPGGGARRCWPARSTPSRSSSRWRARRRRGSRRSATRNVTVRAGDGYRGWPERAPFDAILVTAAPPEIPQPLLDQLAVGGRLVAPVGEGDQELVVVERTAAGLSGSRLIPVRFVPMTGEAQRRK